MLIDDDWVEAHPGRTLDVYDPASGEVIDHVPAGDAEDVDKLDSALATGCAVVLKPAEQTPLSALRLAQLMQEAGLPDGVVNVITGFAETAGAVIAAHPSIDKVAFTGSAEVGKLIVKAAAEGLKRVTLALGGGSPNVALADRDLETAIPGAAHAIFFNHGQCRCAGSRLYIESEVYDDVLAGVADHSEHIKLGRGLNAGTEMGPPVSAEQLERVTGYLESPRPHRRRGRPGRRSRVFRRADGPRRRRTRQQGARRRDLRPGRDRDPVQGRRLQAVRLGAQTGEEAIHEYAETKSVCIGL